jgi:hypothetical protein
VKATLLAAAVLATGSVIKAQLSIGITIGPPPPARVVRVLPERPGPEFLWVGGYWYPVGGHYRWHGGYWTRPPYEGARWVVPHHDGERFYTGYWEGDRGRGTTTTIGTTTTEVMNMTTTMTDTVITTIDSTRRCNCSVALAEPPLRFQKRGLELSLSG